MIYNDIVQPIRDINAMRKALHAVQKDWQLYDARRTFQHWAEMAGIPLIRVKTYAGHISKTVSEKYRTHDCAPYLVSDGQLLRSYIEQQLAPQPQEAPTIVIPQSPFTKKK